MIYADHCIWDAWVQNYILACSTQSLVVFCNYQSSFLLSNTLGEEVPYTQNCLPFFLQQLTAKTNDLSRTPGLSLTVKAKLHPGTLKWQRNKSSKYLKAHWFLEQTFLLLSYSLCTLLAVYRRHFISPCLPIMQCPTKDAENGEKILVRMTKHFTWAATGMFHR